MHTPPTPPDTLVHEVMHLAGPAVLHGLVGTVVLFTDRLILGRLHPDALGSMQISGPVLWSLFSIFAVFGAGHLAVVGRALGAGEAGAAAATVRRVIGLGAAIGLCLAVAGWLGRDALVAVMADTQGTSPQLRAMASDYMAVVFLSAPADLVAVAATTALQADGDTRTPLRIGLLTSALNLVASVGLTFGVGGLPALGVVGAAAGTSLAFIAQAVLTVWVVRRRFWAPRAPATPPPPAPHRVGAVLRISGPALGEKLLYHFGFLVFSAFIGRLGGVAMAAHQALIGIESLGFIAAGGFGIAAGALVARNLGAGAPARAAQGGWVAARLGAGCLSVVGLGFLVGAEWLVGWFSTDPAVVALGARCLRVAVIAQPLMALTDVFAGALRGAGDTVTPLRAALLGPIAVRLVASGLLAFTFELGLLGVWIGSTLDWGVRTVWLGRAFAAGRWQAQRV